MNVFRCPVCGYLHENIPDFHFCPVCSTAAELFSRDESVAHFAGWDTQTRLMIADMAETGHPSLGGKGTTRALPNLDGLMFLPAQIARAPRNDDEPVACEVVLGKQAERPVTLSTPVLNAGMSFGALSREAKMALAKASSLVGGAANTGEGGMLDAERELADHITLQYSTGRFGVSEDRLRQADMIEIKISQGAKPGMGGKLPGAKVTAEIAAIRQVPEGVMAASPARHPDIATPAELADKITELRELTGGVPISVKLVGGRINDDLAALFSQKCVPDVLVVDGAEGGTGAAPTTVKDHVGLPLVASLPAAARFLADNNLRDRVTLIAAGGIRHAGDIAKCIALGAEAVYMAGALKIAMGCKYIRDCHKGTCPFGIATQDPELRARLDVDDAATRIANFITAATREVQALARICGKHSIHDLSSKDLAAIDPLTAAMTDIPMPGGNS